MGTVPTITITTTTYYYYHYHYHHYYYYYYYYYHYCYYYKTAADVHSGRTMARIVLLDKWRVHWTSKL